MATTTNYGWTTPDDTALVKDGASAIRSLGSSVDTTVKNLNPETTLGDIAYRSSTANVNTRLGIGTNGQVLQVVSGVPAWSTIATGGMTLLSTTSLSSTSILLSSISGSYVNLYVIVRDFELAASTPGRLYFRLNDDSTANRHRQCTIASVTTSATTYASQGTYFKNEADNVGWNPSTNYAEILIKDYANASHRKSVDVRYSYYNNAGGETTEATTGSFNDTTAISSLRIGLDAGTFSAGTVLVYGVA